MVEDLKSLFTFETLRNFRLGLMRQMNRYLSQHLSLGETLSHSRDSVRKARQVKFADNSAPQAMDTGSHLKRVPTFRSIHYYWSEKLGSITGKLAYKRGTAINDEEKEVVCSLEIIILVWQSLLAKDLSLCRVQNHPEICLLHRASQ